MYENTSVINAIRGSSAARPTTRCESRAVTCHEGHVTSHAASHAASHTASPSAAPPEGSPVSSLTSVFPGRLCTRRLHEQDPARILTSLSLLTDQNPQQAWWTLERTREADVVVLLTSVEQRANYVAHHLAHPCVAFSTLALWVWVGGAPPDYPEVLSPTRTRNQLFGHPVLPRRRAITAQEVQSIPGSTLLITSPLRTAGDVLCSRYLTNQLVQPQYSERSGHYSPALHSPALHSPALHSPALHSMGTVEQLATLCRTLSLPQLREELESNPRLIATRRGRHNLDALEALHFRSFSRPTLPSAARPTLTSSLYLRTPSDCQDDYVLR